VKTDRRDARTLAAACRLGAYRPAHRTSAAQRVVRAHLAVREALVQTRTRYLNVVRAVLRRDGVRVAPGGAATFAQRVRALPLTATQAAVVAPLLQVLAALRRGGRRVIGWALAGREGAAGGARLSQAHSGFSDHCLVDRRPPPCGVTVSDQSPPAAAART
jgi:hypothetical protein